MQQFPSFNNAVFKETATTVVKRYNGKDAQQRFKRELKMLQVLQDYLPVPQIIDFDTEIPEIRLQYLEGQSGQSLLADGLGDYVLYHSGILLRQIYSLSRYPAIRSASKGTPTLVHGDFGPHNLIFRSNIDKVVYVIDWEWAHWGQVLEDISWLEWKIRVENPTFVEHIPRLYEGYGEVIAWQKRHNAMISKCKEVLRHARIFNPQLYNLWQHNLDITINFSE